MKLHIGCVSSVLLLGGIAQAQDTNIEVTLMGPLSTQTSRKGDRIFAQVLRPDALKGDTVEGKVTDVRAGGKIHGQSVLKFSFETLQHRGTAVPISSQVTSIANSRGQMNVDEEGRVIRKSGNVGKTLGGTGLGGLVGGLAGGARGAAIGAGVGAAASIILIEVAAEGPNIRFDPGSRVILSAKSRGGPALASLDANPAPAPSAAPSDLPSARAAAPAPAPAAPPSNAPAAPAGTGQPDLTALKADFIPGDKVVFYDDFTDMAGDEAPPHWKIRGASLTLKAGGGVRQLTATEKTYMTPLLKGIPRNFTLETDVKYDNPGDMRSTWRFFPKDSDNEALQIWTQTSTSKIRVKIHTRKEVIGENETPVDFGQPVKQALWIQNGRLRFYVNGQRAIDANQVEVPELASARLEPEFWGEGMAIGYRRVRIGESTPDFSQSISASGKYVTHGILFAVDSDRLESESAGVIRSIARGLELNPDLKVCIEGHTDSTGTAEHNMELSKRRAEAVKAVLIAQFRVDPARLTAEGLGSTKPIDSNDTLQGKAQNRRVEFVRQ